MPWKWLLLSYARKKPAKAGFAAIRRIFVEKINFSGFVEFLKKKLQEGMGFIFVFLRYQRLEFFYRLSKISFNIEVMTMSLFVLTQCFNGISTMRQRKTPFLSY